MPSLAVRNAAEITLSGTPGSAASRRKPAAVSTFDADARGLVGELAAGVELLTMSVAFARNLVETWSWRHFASTWSRTSSRLRSRDGVMPSTSYQT